MRMSAIVLFVLLGSVVVGSDGNTVRRGASDKAPRKQARGKISLQRCRLKLIDQVTLASDRPGILSFVEPTEGIDVKRDQPVAGLEDDVARAKAARAEKEAGNDIEVRFAKKSDAVAKIELQKALLGNVRVPGAIPEIEINRLRLAADRSELQIEQAEHNLVLNQLAYDEAKADLRTYQITAPFEGTVTRVYKHKGEAVRQGDPIVEIASTKRIRVEGYVDVADIWNIRAGDRVEVQLAIPDVDLPVEREKFVGRIVFVDLVAQPVTRKVRVWAEVVNRENILRAGLTARMTVFPKKPAD